jgi:protein-tyrosine phosphatase
VVFDAKDEVLNSTFRFTEEALNAGESILIHSVRGQSRSSTIITAYLMKK